MGAPSTPFLAVLTVLAGSTVACGAGSRSALEQQVKRLQDQLTALQGDNDRLSDRVAALEARKREPAPAADAAPDDADANLRHAESTAPRLRVVKVKPKGDAAAPTGEAPKDGAAGKDSERLVIRGEGSKIQVTSEKSP